MLDFSARASPSLRNPTSFCYKSLLFGELLQVAIAICEFYKLLDKQIICKKIINRTLTVKEKKLYMIYDYEYEQGKEFSERNELYINL